MLSSDVWMVVARFCEFNTINAMRCVCKSSYIDTLSEMMYLSQITETKWSLSKKTKIHSISENDFIKHWNFFVMNIRGDVRENLDDILRIVSRYKWNNAKEIMDDMYAMYHCIMRCLK